MAETKDQLSIFISGMWDQTALVAIAGSMVMENGLQLRDAIAELLSKGVQHLVLNVQDVEGIDGMGLGVLVSAMNRLRSCRGTISFVAPSPVVSEVLQVTRLSDAVQVFPNEKEAIRILKTD